MDEPQNCRHQSRYHGGKGINGRRESKEMCLEDAKNYNQHQDVKLSNFPSYECKFKNSRKHDKQDLRMTAVSDERLEKSRTRKSRSPLTNRRLRNQKSQEDPLESFKNHFEMDEQSIYPDRDRYTGKIAEKLQKKKSKDENLPDCMETIHEDDEILKIHKKMMKNEKGKLKAQRCLHELKDLKNELEQFEYKKMAPKRNLNDQNRRNCLNSNNCPKVLQPEESDMDNYEEEEENKLLEEELNKISFCEPCSHPKHLVKTPETTTSTTETSIMEDVDGRRQRTIQRVIGDAMMRESAYNADKTSKHTHDDEASSEGSCSENDEDPEETPRGSQNHDNESAYYIDELKNLRWRYLNHIQDELNRLYDLEQFLDTLATKNLKSGRRRESRKVRPTTRAAGLQ